MSALPPKADMCGAVVDVRFGPIADMHQLFNHLVGALLQVCAANGFKLPPPWLTSLQPSCACRTRSS